MSSSRHKTGLAALVLLLAFVSTGVHAAAPGVLEELTRTELRDATGRQSTIILPVGGTEQSGPQMALGKHNVRARVLAGRIAAALGNALVAPVWPTFPKAASRRRPATCASRHDLDPRRRLRGTLEGAARSFRQGGFRDIVLIGDHGGYQGSLKKVAAQLNREWASPRCARTSSRILK